MREQERDKSPERVRDRSPMVPRVGLSPPRPPDPPVAAADPPRESCSPGTQPQLVADNEVNAVLVEDIPDETMIEPNKERKCDGDYSGDILLPPREETWMDDDAPLPHRQKTTPESPRLRPPMSYRDAVKPSRPPRDAGKMPSSDLDHHPASETLEDDWDGNLVNSNKQDMMTGVTVKESSLGLEIEFSEVEKSRLEKKWGQSLIIKLLGGTLGFMQMKRRVQAMWGVGGKVELSDIGNGFFIASFSDMDDYFFALEGGPWLIQNHYLTVQTWKRNFNAMAENIRHVAIWIRLPGLPGDYYDQKFFYNLGNRIGKAIKVDEMTLKRARTMYARMCVEIDLKAPLLPSYTVDGNLLKIEYEGLHMICFHCGKFGHDDSHCPAKQTLQVSGARSPNLNSGEAGDGGRTPTSAGEGNSKYGGWMIAQDPKRKGRPTARDANKKGQKTAETKKDVMMGVSRFAVLSEENEVDTEMESSTGVRQPMEDISNVNVGRLKEVKRKAPSAECAEEKQVKSMGKKASGPTIINGSLRGAHAKRVEAKTQGDSERTRMGPQPEREGEAQKDQSLDAMGQLCNQMDQSGHNKVHMGQNESTSGLNREMDPHEGLVLHGPNSGSTNEDMHFRNLPPDITHSVLNHLPKSTMDWAENLPPDQALDSQPLGLSAVENMILRENPEVPCSETPMGNGSLRTQ